MTHDQGPFLGTSSEKPQIVPVSVVQIDPLSSAPDPLWGSVARLTMCCLDCLDAALYSANTGCFGRQYSAFRQRGGSSIHDDLPALRRPATGSTRPGAHGRRRLPRPIQGPVQDPHRMRSARTTCAGASNAPSTHSTPPAPTSSSTSAGCRKTATTHPAQSRAGCRPWRASTALASSTACSSTLPQSTYAARR